MNACEYLARVGFAVLLREPAVPRDEDDSDSIESARLADHANVREVLLSKKAAALTGRDGAAWIKTITWPDRVAGLKSWAGQQTLPKIINKLQKAVAAADAGKGDLFELRHPLKGVTGIDGLTAQSAIDIGFSPAALDMAIVQRPALELLAIVGLESVPLVSFGFRECGFVHADRVWRFPVESRDGDYYHRWGDVRPITRLDGYYPDPGWYPERRD